MRHIDITSTLIFCAICLLYSFFLFMSFRTREKTSFIKVIILNIICPVYMMTISHLWMKFPNNIMAYTFKHLVYLFNEIHIANTKKAYNIIALLLVCALYYVFPLYIINKMLKKIYTTKSLLYSCIAVPFLLMIWFILVLELGYSS